MNEIKKGKTRNNEIYVNIFFFFFFFVFVFGCFGEGVIPTTW